MAGIFIFGEVCFDTPFSFASQFFEFEESPRKSWGFGSHNQNVVEASSSFSKKLGKISGLSLSFPFLSFFFPATFWNRIEPEIQKRRIITP
jgi:hypothetical protein